MVEHQAVSAAPTEGLDRVFAALADPTRRAILQRLTTGDAAVGELSEPFDMSLAAVSKHLDVLERAGLVVRETRGRERRCHLDARPLRAAAEWTSRYRAFWESRLDALDALLRARRSRAADEGPPRPPSRTAKKKRPKRRSTR